MPGKKWLFTLFLFQIFFSITNKYYDYTYMNFCADMVWFDFGTFGTVVLFENIYIAWSNITI